MNGQPEIEWGVPAGGVFTDGDYARLQEEGSLFVDRPDGEALVFEQAHLIVHVGDEYRKTFDRDSAQVVELAGGEEIEVPPRGVALITTAEHFDLPDSVQGQVSPRGTLTTVGFAFPTTHVDPGFCDHLYLPFVNSGQRTITLKRGQAIGKVELQALHRDVEKPWSKGVKSSFAAPEPLPGKRSNEVRLRRWHLWLALCLIGPPAAFGWVEMLGGPAEDLWDTLGDIIDVPGVTTGLIVAAVVGAFALVRRYIGRRRSKDNG